VEVITDKVNAEVPSTAAGVLEEIVAAEGQTVPVGAVIALIGDGSRVTQPAAELGAEAAAATPSVSEAANATASEPPRPTAAPQPAAEPSPAVAAPAPQRAAAAPASAAPSSAADDEHLPVSPIRKAIADHMVRSVQTSPHAWSMVEVDMTEISRLRSALQSEWS